MPKTNAKKPRSKRASDKKMAHVGTDTAKERETSIPFGWDVFRDFYSPAIIQAAERLFDDNALNIQTVMMVQTADVLRVRGELRHMSIEDDKYLQLERLAAQQLRHLRLMAERFGANASADNQLVQVPQMMLDLDFSDPRIMGDDDIVH